MYIRLLNKYVVNRFNNFLFFIIYNINKQFYFVKYIDN